jgi:hypothetical protein
VKLDGTGLNPTYIVGPRIGTKSGSPVNTPVPMVVSDGYIYWGNLYDGYIGRVPNLAGATNPNNKFIGILGSATGLALNHLFSPGPLPPPTPPDIDLFSRTSSGSSCRGASSAACSPSSRPWTRRSRAATRRRRGTVSRPLSTRRTP